VDQSIKQHAHVLLVCTYQLH